VTVSSCLATRYGAHTVRTRTFLAQLLPVLETVFGNELSTMIIISTAVHLNAHGQDHLTVIFDTRCTAGVSW
jgi:hypothetical protein